MKYFFFFNISSGIATASGKEWKEQRTVIMHILRSFGFGKNIFALRVSEEVNDRN